MQIKDAKAPCNNVAYKWSRRPSSNSTSPAWRAKERDSNFDTSIAGGKRVSCSNRELNYAGSLPVESKTAVFCSRHYATQSSGILLTRYFRRRGATGRGGTLLDMQAVFNVSFWPAHIGLVPTEVPRSERAVFEQ